MFARTTRIEGKPEKVEEAIAEFRNNVLPTASQMRGFNQAYLLVNRSSGNLLSMVFFDTEQDIKNTAEMANRLRTHIAQTVGETISPKFDIYEVAVQHSREAAKL